MPLSGEIQGNPVSLTLMDRFSGQADSGARNIVNSIIDILTTPVGTRVMRRDYGSNLFNLIDKPVDSYLMLNLYAATAEALGKWEPRVIISKMNFIGTRIKEGILICDLFGTYAINGAPFTLQALTLNFFGENNYGVIIN